MKRTASYRNSLLAVRIVRRAVVTIGYSVAVAIAKGAVVDIALAVPATALENPAAVALFPAVRMPVVAAALALPVADAWSGNAPIEAVASVARRSLRFHMRFSPRSGVKVPPM